MGILKKIAVAVPVLVLSAVYPVMYHFQQFRHASHKRIVAMIIAIVLFYVWMAIGIIRRKQALFFEAMVQAAFYVYVFCVLTLTGYFIFFNEVSAHHWWHKMLQRIDLKEGVNLTPLLFMKSHPLLNYDVVGNAVMLLPLGIFLPLLYKNLQHFFTVSFTAMLVSVSIELMQLATNTRITDIDDVILNTAGASCGFIIYLLVKKTMLPQQKKYSLY